MSRLLCCLGFVIFGSANVFAQSTEFTMLERPSHGVLFAVPEQGAMVYAHIAGAPAEDAFSVAVTQPNGDASFNDILIAGDMRHVFVSTLAFGATAAVQDAAFANDTPDREDDPWWEISDELGVDYVIVIYVDQPGDGGDRDVHEGLDVGHTFIEFIDGETGEESYYGFYPDGIHDDEGHDWDVRYEIEVTKEEFYEMLAEAEEDLADAPDYNLSDFNCSDWVIDLVEEGTGIELPDTQGDFPLGLPDGTNPGDLGEDLVEIGGERNEDTP